MDLHTVQCLRNFSDGVLPRVADLGKLDGHGPVRVWVDDIVNIEGCWSKDDNACWRHEPLVAAESECLEKLLPCSLVDPPEAPKPRRRRTLLN